tara:strand:+ start:2420 stop:2767 length:348 start_codon:yes stop_codon:yes gene_type:complete
MSFSKSALKGEAKLWKVYVFGWPMSYLAAMFAAAPFAFLAESSTLRPVALLAHVLTILICLGISFGWFWALYKCLNNTKFIPLRWLSLALIALYCIVMVLAGIGAVIMGVVSLFS